MNYINIPSVYIMWQADGDSKLWSISVTVKNVFWFNSLNNGNEDSTYFLYILYSIIVYSI